MERADYAALFSMLAAGRFDAFSRSVFEISAEYRDLDHERIFIEPRHLFEMDTGIFFYVSKNNSALRDILTQGMQSLYCTGEFEKFMRHHASTREAFSRVLDRTRTVVHLDSPALPAEEARALRDYPASRAALRHGTWASAHPSRSTICKGRP